MIFRFLTSLFLGLSELLESLSRNTRLLDHTQRGVNLLLADRERLLLNLRNVSEAIRIEGQEGLRGVFGDDQRIEEFFEFSTQAEAPLYRSAFHREYPALAAYSYDQPEAGPSGTQHDAESSNGSTFGLNTAAGDSEGEDVVSEQAAAPEVSGDGPLIVFSP